MRGAPWLAGAMAPWHLWGSTERNTVSVPSGTTSLAQQQHQLCRIAYKRPDSWRFLLGLKLTQSSPLVSLNTTAITAAFDLTIGLGRSSITIAQFAVLGFSWPAADTAPLNITRWCTSVSAGLRIASDLIPNIVDQFPAQDIQVSVTIAMLALTAPASLGYEVSAYFAPQTHIRPDWLNIDASPEEQFGGAETSGK